jgi:hypothetical protein
MPKNTKTKKPQKDLEPRRSLESEDRLPSLSLIINVLVNYYIKFDSDFEAFIFVADCECCVEMEIMRLALDLLLKPLSLAVSYLAN